MPKSAFFSTVQRALRLAALSEKQQMSAAETLERRAVAREETITRRDFMKTTGAGLAGIAVGPSLGWLPRVQGVDPKVVIVGAGVAGLTAAYRLSQAGLNATIYEASGRFGGRMQSAVGKFDGQSAEIGGEFIDSGHESTRALAKELGLTEIDLFEADEGLTIDTFYFKGQKISEETLIKDFAPVAKAIIADLETLTGDDVTYDAPNGAEKLDQLSIAAWLDQKSITGTIRQILEVAYTSEYGREIGEQNVFNLLYLIGTEDGALKLYGESDERYHIKGGNELIPTMLAANLKKPVELNHVLEAMRPGANTGYTLTFRRDKTTVEVQADAVIMTIPFLQLRKVDLNKLSLPAPKKNAIDKLGYGMNSKVIVGMKDRVWRAQGSNGGTFSDLPYRATWETVRYQDGNGGVLTDYLGGKAALAALTVAPEKAAADFVDQIEKVFPGAKAAYSGKYDIADWPKRAFIECGYSCYLPGQMTTIRGLEQEPVGMLFFAGEHTSLGAQGYMDGGVESGERAADEALVGLGLKK